ncbi:MAG: hypothetical protein WAO77_05365 [Sphingobium sp.]|uniref:hypothetical protein n=1 Tax=unclassified Sphingobium TaxID=2611147 RepID=UPI001268681C|nr:hypothetical protein [Sphingobium sp. C100]
MVRTNILAVTGGTDSLLTEADSPPLFWFPRTAIPEALEFANALDDLKESIPSPRCRRGSSVRC